jgi:hypothetical protein
VRAWGQITLSMTTGNHYNRLIPNRGSGPVPKTLKRHAG